MLLQKLSVGSWVISVSTVCLLQGLLVLGQGKPDPCSPVHGNNAGHTLPSIKNQYFARVDWRQIGMSRSVYMEVYFDQPGQRSATRVTGFYDKGVSTTAIADYKTLSLFTFQGGKCTRSNLTSQDTFTFQHRTYTNGSGDLLNAHYALGLDTNLTYIGPDTVRDIPADLWQGCHYEFDKAAGQPVTTFLFVYFSRPDWITASGSRQVPLRKRVKTVTGTSSVENNYDYVYFQESLPVDSSIFTLQHSASCSAGSSQTLALPRLPRDYSFGMEVTLAGRTESTYVNVWMDDVARLVRLDTADSQGNSRRQVQDFTNGISYVMNMANYSYHVSLLAVDAGLADVLYMTPAQLFYLSNNVKYDGQTTVRNILAHVWYGTRTDFPPGNNQTTVWTWYFSDAHWSMIAPGNTSSQVPLKVVVNFPMSQTTYTYNIMDFKGVRPDTAVFDVTPCYVHSDIRYIEFSLIGGYVIPLAHGPKPMYDAVRAYLMAQLNVTQIRIQKLKIILSKTGARVRFALLGFPAFSNVAPSVSGYNLTSVLVQRLMHLIDSDNFVVHFRFNMGDRQKLALFKGLMNSMTVTARDVVGTVTDIRDPPSPTSTKPTSPAVTLPSTSQKPCGHFLQQSTSSSPGASTGQQGMAAGAVAGLALGTTTVGLLLGILATVFVVNKHQAKYRKRSMDRQLTDISEQRS